MTQKNQNKGSPLFVYVAATSVNLLTLGIGIAYAWCSPTIPKLKTDGSLGINPIGRPTTLFEDSWITSLLNVGALVGPLVAGPLSDKIGRKRTLLMFSLPMILSHVMLIIATNVMYFFAARFLKGVTVGASFSVMPIYLSEISTKENRGLLGLSFSLSNAIGQLFTYCIGPYVSIPLFSMIALVPCVIFLATFAFFIPESPYYYMYIERKKDAEDSLKQLRGRSYTDKELKEISKDVEESKQLGKSGVIDLFRNKLALKGLMIGCGLMFVQVFSGILPVVSFMQTIFISTGTSIPGDISVMIIGIFQLITIIIVSKIVDHISRKVLFLMSVIGSVLSLANLGCFFYLKNQTEHTPWSWIPIASLLGYFICFSLGLGPLVWNVAGEVFAPNFKSIGSTLLTLSNILLGFGVALIFPITTELLGMAGVFWSFAGITCLSIPFIIFVVPDTKGKSLLEIQRMLGGEKIIADTKC